MRSSVFDLLQRKGHGLGGNSRPTQPERLNMKSKLLATIPVFLVYSALASPPRDSIKINPSDCSVINEAIQQLPKSGGVIALMAGQFVCEFPVLIDKNNVTLRGAGVGRTQLKLAAFHPAPLLVIGAMETREEQTPSHGIQYYPVRETLNVTIEDLSLDGNATEQFRPGENPHDKECYDLRERRAVSCDGDGGRHVRNNALTIRRGRNIKVKRVQADNSLSGGVVVEKRSSGLNISDLSAERNLFDGLAGYETRFSLFQNINVKANRFSGVSIDFDFEDNTFYNIDMSENGDNGLFSRGVSRNRFVGVKAIGNRNFGLYFDGLRWNEELIPHSCDDIELLDSHIKNSGADGLRINHQCENFQIRHTQIEASTNKLCYSLWPGVALISDRSNKCHQNGEGFSF